MPALIDYLVKRGDMDEAKASAVLEKAGDSPVGLDEALVSMSVVDATGLGTLYSDCFQLPYIPLQTAVAADAAALVSGACSRAWQAMPLQYDPSQNLLTLAVSSAEQMKRVEQLHRLMMQPHSVAFTIAPASEIAQSLANSGAKAAAVADAPAAPKQKKKLAGLKRSLEQSPKTSIVRKAPGYSAAPAAGTPTDAELAYADMSRALLSMAAFMVTARLQSEPTRLEDARARVRYGQLLASRLSLMTTQADAVCLAAWLSSLDDSHDVLAQCQTSYKLEEIIYPAEHPDGADRIETSLLSLICCYQKLKREEPDSVKDVHVARRKLRMLWAATPEKQETLETFLQVLMDEEFLASLDRVSGRVLVIDPDEETTPNLTPPLKRDGYEVITVSDSGSASIRVAEHAPDLILCAMDLPGGSGLTLCQRMKKDPETAGIPFVILIDAASERRAAECLHAGADDYVVKPVDLELLYIKLERLMDMKPVQAEDKDGVSGSLDDMGFTDMIQILSAGNKSMEIELEGPNGKGEVFVREGDVIHAKTDDKNGDQAFYALMQWTEGDFTTRQCTEFPEQTIDEGLMSLLMEGSRIADEGL